MKKILVVLLFFVLTTQSFAQKKKLYTEKPRLVVGIIIDQLRYDYLYRYADKYSKGGLMRLMNEGFNCQNNHYNYAFTVTAAGHTSVYTGSVPAIHGIAGNEWYNATLDREVYCTEDSTARTVGSDSKAGRMSPRNMKVTTICDQNRIATNFRAKTIGIALKDRGAILPAGHSANAAYWFDSKDGNWITSTYYMNETPQWVKDFNIQKIPSQYIKDGWNTLLPMEQYTQSTADNKPYEGKLAGETTPTFPHELLATRQDVFEVIRTTPFGNSLTKDFALAAIAGEQLGQDSDTDFLAVSFSSTDYIGHTFGPNSVEAQDGMLRLDKDLEQMLAYLDTNVGKDQYLVFLTADHGVMDVPGFWQENHLPAGVFGASQVRTDLKKAMNEKFGEGDWLLSTANYQIHLNHALMEQKNVSINSIFEVVKQRMMQEPAVKMVVNMHDINNSMLNTAQTEKLKNVYYPKRTGDFYIVLEPNWFEGRSTGTTHGTMYNYDTHVPLLFYGWKVPKGRTFAPTSISDIAPTIAAFLNVLEPSGNIGKPIVEVLELK